MSDKNSRDQTAIQNVNKFNIFKPKTKLKTHQNNEKSTATEKDKLTK